MSCMGVRVREKAGSELDLFRELPSGSSDDHPEARCDRCLPFRKLFSFATYQTRAIEQSSYHRLHIASTTRKQCADSSALSRHVVQPFLAAQSRRAADPGPGTATATTRRTLALEPAQRLSAFHLTYSVARAAPCQPAAIHAAAQSLESTDRP